MKEAVIKLTDKCPCHCNFCESGNGLFRNHRDLTDEQIFSIADLLIENGLQICVISGGEALLRKQLANNLIYHLKLHGVYVVLNVSGVLFSKQSIDDFLTCNPNLIVFSLDSVIAEKHDRFRGVKGLFATVKRTIKDIIERESTMAVGVRFVMTRHNYSEIGDMIRMCSSWNIDCLKITNIENDATMNYSLSEVQSKTLFETVLPDAISAVKQVVFQNELLREEAMNKLSGYMSGMSASDFSANLFAPSADLHATCPLGGQFVLVGGNGNIYPCCESEHHGMPILGIAGNCSIEEIETNLAKLRFDRLEYCKHCTIQRNIQIDFTTRCIVVNDRCRTK